MTDDAVTTAAAGGVAVFSRGIAAVPGLPVLLGAATHWRPATAAGLAAVVAWGHRPSTRRALAWARAQGLPLWRLEDGFLRSVATGSAGDAPLSIVVDDLGIHYDASAPSRLEQLVLAGADPAQAARALALVAAWCAGRVSKYNHAREQWVDGDRGPSSPEHERDGDGPVLVADQTFGDASIVYGAADATSFARMLEAALDEHPTAPVLLKVHPEVLAGAKRGHFQTRSGAGGLTPGQAARVRVLGADVHPPALLERARAVYAVTSQMGFEGLLWGRPVRCFGLPFYAGWGLTRDALAPPARRAPGAGLPALVHAALVAYPRYLDPETGRRCEVETVLAHLALQRQQRERFAPQVHAVGFSAWKKPIVRAYFGGSTVRFARSLRAVPAAATVALWGRQLPAAAPGRYGRVVRLEDGFLRSVGLGADLIRPLSWVMDDVGLYYDATAPSGLETLLATRDFTPAELARAAALRERLCALGITKYNLPAGADWQRPAGAAGRTVILVPGQVEDDASLRYGAGVALVGGAAGAGRDAKAFPATNLALLQAVRRRHPEAWLLYKPHPDVAARLREAGKGEAQARDWCDEVIGAVPMHRLLAAVDAVHTLTSLAGFEALLRGRAVSCHGRPFYAGWGLTEDLGGDVPGLMQRRGRPLALDALVAGALVEYPTYVSQVTGLFTTPERVLDELAAGAAAGTAPARSWWRQLRRTVLGTGSRLRRRWWG